MCKVAIYDASHDLTMLDDRILDMGTWSDYNVIPND